jgi:hypothetical protein
VNRLEEADQVALMQWAALVQVGAITLAELLVHVPNGGARSASEGGRFKAMGVKPGVPDLLLPVRTSEYGAGWWELKHGRGRLEESQLTRHAILRASGHYVQTYWTWSEAAADMLRYLQKSHFLVIVRAKL